LRRAIGLILVVERTVLVRRNRPLDVVSDEQIQLAIIVIIKPDRAHGESGIGHARFRGHLHELAIAEIAKEMVGTESGYVDIAFPFIVIFAAGAAPPVHFYREPRLPGHIGEGAILIVVIECRKRYARLVSGPVHGIDEKDVLPSVIVVVEKAGAA